MKYVTCFGAVYRISERNYLRLLRAVAAGEGADLDKHGARPVGFTIHRDVTDITEEEAQEDLEYLVEKRKH